MNGSHLDRYRVRIIYLHLRGLPPFGFVYIVVRAREQIDGGNRSGGVGSELGGVTKQGTLRMPGRNLVLRCMLQVPAKEKDS